MRVKERGILFSGEMVKALLAGNKSQTRRIIDNAPEGATKLRINDQGWLESYLGDLAGIPEDSPHAWELVYGGWEKGIRAPYQPGDRLWVREAWRTLRAWDKCSPSGLPMELRSDDPDDWPTMRDWYIQHEAGPVGQTLLHGKLRPGMFMPRWASRLQREVVSVRVERIQDISEADARAEGVKSEWCDDGGETPGRYLFFTNADRPGKGHATARAAFQILWDSLNAKRGFGWNVNPWVWAYSLKEVA